MLDCKWKLFIKRHLFVSSLQAKIAVLVGERKGQESLKSDLIRRIKMLEYALKQERAKFHRLKYGVDPPMNDIKPPTDEPGIGTEVAPGK